MVFIDSMATEQGKIRQQLGPRKKWLLEATKYATVLLGDEEELKLEIPKQLENLDSLKQKLQQHLKEVNRLVNELEDSILKDNEQTFSQRCWPEPGAYCTVIVLYTSRQSQILMTTFI